MSGILDLETRNRYAIVKDCLEIRLNRLIKLKTNADRGDIKALIQLRDELEQIEEAFPRTS